MKIFNQKINGLLILLSLLGSSLALASTRVENTKPLLLQSSEAILTEQPPIADDTPTSRQAQFLSQVSSPVTHQSSQVAVAKALLNQLPAVANETPAPRRAEF